MRPVAFGEALSAGTRLTLFSDDKPDRFIGAFYANTGERCASVRDRALALLLFYTALRIGECASLDTDDVALSARKGKITVTNDSSQKHRRCMYKFFIVSPAAERSSIRNA